jgi:acyl-CoA dehydrogenase
MTVILLLMVLVVALVVVVAVHEPFRHQFFTTPVFRLYRKVLPAMSDTERDALEAGSVWWEGELFRGEPQWQLLLDYPKPKLTEREQAFLDNEVNEACRLTDDWQVSNHDGDLTAETWQYIKAKGFLGMIIPQRYGGLEFSAFAHSEVISKLSTRSSALAVSVMVPNSLGPAELLLHYGTEAQKNHFLPRLASGEDIPAFALTSPWAGSDAAAIPDVGVVRRGEWMGEEVLGMEVTWDKRYITLAPVCTVLGLAFRLFDPEGLLGDEKDIGITCALVPHDHPGVAIGNRHQPLNGMFMNGPTRGNKVFMPLDFIIGGKSMAGHGWKMLMECLAAGRSISLPSSNAGMARMTARAVGAYARVRSQFKLAVGKFEGVEEALARIASDTYSAEAIRKMTAGAIDLGERPSVVSAIVKYHVTEQGRRVVNDGMDIIGGKGICMGPSNFLARAYQQLPVGITVEGANILTRSLILFGQGAIRCHPFVQAEMNAAQMTDEAKAFQAFDTAICGHVRYTLQNALRAFGLGITASWFSRSPASKLRRSIQRMNHFSASFALLADVAMLIYGGELKRKEKISARLGDILSQLYIASAILKNFHDDSAPPEDVPLAKLAIGNALHRTQIAFDGVLANLPIFIGVALKWWMFPWGRIATEPCDDLGHKAASLLLSPNSARDRLTAQVYLPQDENQAVSLVEKAMVATIAAEPTEAKIRTAEKNGQFLHNPLANVRDIALAARDTGILSEPEFALVQERNRLRDRVIRVDEFTRDLSEWVRPA